MKKLTTILLSLLVYQHGNAQDHLYSQTYASPIYTNPAMAGTAFCKGKSAGRFSSTFRRNPVFEINNISIAVDQHINFLNGGVGIMYNFDNIGDGLSKKSTISLAYNYLFKPIKDKDFNVRVGINGGLIRHRKLIQVIGRFPNQTIYYEPQFITYPNFATGFLVYNPHYFAGFAIHNILEPVESFYGNAERYIPRRYTAHAGINIKIGKNKNILSPTILFDNQENITVFEVGVNYNFRKIETGIRYKEIWGEFTNLDILTTIIGYRSDKIRVGYSIDVEISSGRSAIKYTHEISAAYNWCLNKGEGEKSNIHFPAF